MSITVTNLSSSTVEVGGIFIKKGQTKTNVQDSGLSEVKLLAAQGIVSYVWTPDTPAASLTAQQVAQTQALVSGDGNNATWQGDDVVSLASSGTVKAGGGYLRTVRCTSGTSITLTVYDNNAAASGATVYTGTLSAGGAAVVNAWAIDGLYASFASGAFEFDIAEAA